MMVYSISLEGILLGFESQLHPLLVGGQLERCHFFVLLIPQVCNGNHNRSESCFRLINSNNFI